MTAIKLAWAPDSIGLAEHFIPLGNPANSATGGENNREHFAGNADRFHDDAGIEIHVGIEFFLNKVLVFQGDFFKTSTSSQVCFMTLARGSKFL